MTDWSNDAERAVGLSRFWPQSRRRSPAWKVRRPIKPGPARQPRDPGLDQDAVDVDAAQARAEAVVADHHHGGPAFAGQLAEPADRFIQAADHLGRRGVPVGAVDSGLIDVQIGPDPVLERVEVLELDHQDRPVGDDPVGEPAPFGAAAEALGGQPGVGGQLFERLGRTLPEVAQAVAGRLGLAAGRRTRARPRGRLRDGARPCPKRRFPAP